MYKQIYWVILFIQIGFFSTLGAQDHRLDYWGNPDEFIENQTNETLGLIDQLLQKNPPQLLEPEIRKISLFALDGILHDPRLDNSKLISSFLEKRVRALIPELKKRPAFGLNIYKLYNHSFIVQTSTVTVAFDLIRGGNEQNRLLSDSLMSELVKNCDVLFVSHIHGDHADIKVAQMFIEDRKEVYCPKNTWEDFSPYLKQIDPGMVSDFQKSYFKQIRVMPGHQGEDVTNHVYLITTADNYTIAHTGDQSLDRDFEWIYRIKDIVSIDVLLVNCWTNKLTEAIKGFNPNLVITGHENELGHSVDHREPYWLTYRRLQEFISKSIVMTWGERYLYTK